MVKTIEKVQEGSGLPYAEHVVPVLPGTPEMEALLQPAYQMTVADAEELIRLRTEDVSNVPWDVLQKAKALLAAYSTVATVVPNAKKAWTRGPRPM